MLYCVHASVLVQNFGTTVCSCSLDTLFIDNNSPMQWSIKMKFAPLGSPLKSAQVRFKTTSFGEGTKKLCGCKNTHTFTLGKWFDHSCFEYT